MVDTLPDIPGLLARWAGLSSIAFIVMAMR
jgi:hypothetical protein